MIRNVSSVVIKRPVAEVFEYASNLENLAKADKTIESISRSGKGALGVGSQFKGRRKIKGREFNPEFTLTEFEASKTVAWKETGVGGDPEGIFRVEQTQEGTRLTLVTTMKTSGALRFLEFLSAGVIKKQDTHVLKTFKSTLEARNSVKRK